MKTEATRVVLTDGTGRWFDAAKLESWRSWAGADGETLYWIDSRGRDTAALVAQDMASGARTVLAQDSRVDIPDAMFNPITGRVEAYPATYLTTEWIALDAAVRADLDFLQGALKGEISIASRTHGLSRTVSPSGCATIPARIRGSQ